MLFALGALALAGASFAQVPSGNDTSDPKGNTGMGYASLGGRPAANGAVSNTAVGTFTLVNNTTGAQNTASGAYVLQSNTTGINNTASGYEALYTNVTGNGNTAGGFRALYLTKVSYNTAFGYEALYRTNAHFNIGIGYQAGLNLTSGAYNIDIGNPGVAAESGTIRIGTQVPTALQTITYIAGIYNNTSVSGLTVVVDSNGQLGAVASSERFKTAVRPMGSNSAKLQQLRPVTFKLKSDPHGDLRYGLIAEEVARVYPELVIRNESGRIDGVRYDELAPMLLNEVQKQAAEIRRLKQREKTVGEMQEQLAEMHAALLALQAKDEFTAQR